MGLSDNSPLEKLQFTLHSLIHNITPLRNFPIGFFSPLHSILEPKITSFIKEEVISHAQQIISKYGYENSEEAMNDLYGDVEHSLSKCFSDKSFSNFELSQVTNGNTDSFLIWQKKASYYCRLTDHLNNMFFEVEDYRLEFRLQTVQAEEGGKNKPKRYFFLASGLDPVVIQRKKRIVSVKFEYRR